MYMQNLNSDYKQFCCTQHILCLRHSHFY